MPKTSLHLEIALPRLGFSVVSTAIAENPTRVRKHLHFSNSFRFYQKRRPSSCLKFMLLLLSSGSCHPHFLGNSIESAVTFLSRTSPCSLYSSLRPHGHGHFEAREQGSCLTESKNESHGQRRVRKAIEFLLSKGAEEQKLSGVRGVPMGLPLRVFRVGLLLNVLSSRLIGPLSKD